MTEKMFHHLGHFLWLLAVDLGWIHSLLSNGSVGPAAALTERTLQQIRTRRKGHAFKTFLLIR